MTKKPYRPNRISGVTVVIAAFFLVGGASIVLSQGGSGGVNTNRPKSRSTRPNPAKKPTTSKATPMPMSASRPTNPNIKLVKIPPGSFMMGSSESEAQSAFQLAKQYRREVRSRWFDDEQPKHHVKINYSFYIGKYEVTQTQWQAVMGSNPSHFKSCARCPVEKVSWDDAQDFIRRLNQMNDGYTYRLPTEAEWEYACRAGKASAFAFGDSLSPAQANFDGRPVYAGYRDETTAVGSFPPNAWGLFDMHGNVSEWCEDWYHKTYDGAPTDGSAWLIGGEQKTRVLRGGSWYTNGYDVRSADRGDSFAWADFRNIDLGFRVVAVARPPN